MLSNDLVTEVNVSIHNNLTKSFIVAIGVLGIVVAEILITLITYCICRKCFDEKVGELNIKPLPEELAGEQPQSAG
jgi:hypothetical protein